MYLVPKTIEEFNRSLSTSVGFDSFFNRLFDDAFLANSSQGYPPYNIRKVTDTDYVIELALAGFVKDDLDIELTNGTLTIKQFQTKNKMMKVIYIMESPSESLPEDLILLMMSL